MFFSDNAFLKKIITLLIVGVILCHLEKGFQTFDIRKYLFFWKNIHVQSSRDQIFYFLWQVKVKVVTKVSVEDVELSVVDKEQNIKSKTLR